MSEAGRIVRVNPAAAIPGGEVVVEGADFDTGGAGTCGAWFSESRGHIVGASCRQSGFRPRRRLALRDPLRLARAGTSRHALSH